MKIRKILKIAVCIIVILIMIAGAGFLVYTMPRNVELDQISSEGTVVTGKYTFLFDKENGCFSVAKNGTTIFENAVSAYKADDKIVKSSDYSSFEIEEEAINGGKRISVNMLSEELNHAVQIFNFYDEKDYFTTEVSIRNTEKEFETNYIAPLIIENGKLQNSTYKWENALEVPSDNDQWAEFKVKKLYKNSVSYEVGALFTPDNGSGFILGSLNHDIWKSAVRFNGGFGKIQSAELYCGATDPKTGNQIHGTVAGDVVSSPVMFIGVYDNWKDGMNEFAEANTEMQPKRASVSDSVPLGWNSWGSVQFDINYDTAVGISQYVKDNLQDKWQTDGENIYINLDSGWDFLSDEELKNFADYCHSNNQKAGAYWGPFVCWLNEEEMKTNYIADTEFTYEDVRLKKSDGTYYGNEVDGCYPLDVTHPAVIKQAEKIIGKMKAAGIDYVKLDFLVHGSFEGDFYDKNITTGIEAYNFAMKYVTDLIGDDVFVNLAMSPTFPYQYANGRRLACDSYCHIQETEYTLNAVTYGFWEQKLYEYTDPDHLVVWGKEADAGEAEARSRITSGVISGTSFLTGDNFINPSGNADEAQERFVKMLANTDIIRVAKTGKVFIPVITDVKNRTANIFMLEDNGKLYAAVINYKNKNASFELDLNDKTYTAVELWSGSQVTADGTLKVELGAKDAALYELTEIN